MEVSRSRKAVHSNQMQSSCHPREISALANTRQRRWGRLHDVGAVIGPLLTIRPAIKNRRRQAAGFGLIIVESSGIGQADTEIVDISDLSLYVMTPEYGAAMQLEKIDMLDYADFVAINKFDRPKALDALREAEASADQN